MPHKLAIVPLLDRLEIGAELVEAVNTVTRRHNGMLIGSNTDGAGFLEPLRPFLEREHLFRMARVLGTGGAGRAIVAALAEQGVVIVLAGRDPAKAQALLEAIDPGGEHHAVDLAHFAEPTDFAFDDRAGCFDLVVNASPLGMAGQPPLALDLSHIPPGSIVYDIVTHPLDTPLLQAARAAGFQTIDGLAMLIGQAAIAFERFFGQPPPRDDGDRGLRALLSA
jgi:shikimate dehydrogenase